MSRPHLTVIEGHRRELEYRAMVALFEDEQEFERLLRQLKKPGNSARSVVSEENSRRTHEHREAFVARPSLLQEPGDVRPAVTSQRRTVTDGQQ